MLVLPYPVLDDASFLLLERDCCVVSVTLKGINVAVLFVADLERSKSFYRNTIGLELTFEDQDSAYFQLEAASLLLLSIASAQDLLTREVVAARHPNAASSQLVSFVEDVDAVYRELAAKGVEFVTEPIDRAWGMRTAHFKDPDGNIWEISQSLADDASKA